MSSSAKSILNRLLKKEAGIKLKDDSFLEKKAELLAASVDFRKIKPENFISDIQNNIAHWQSVYRKVGLISSIPALLLFVSIMGVRFKISFLGISLDNIENLKEVIFVLLACSQVLAFVLGSGISRLKAIRNAVYIRKYGSKQLELAKHAFKTDFPDFDLDLNIIDDDYRATTPKVVIDIIRSISVLLLFIIFMATVYIVEFVIMYDIWTSSNLPSPYGKYLVAFVAPIAIVCSVTGYMKSSFKFWYIDRSKEKTFSITDPQGDIKEDVSLLIDKSVERSLHRRMLFKSFFWGILIAVFYIYFFYASFWSARPS